MIGRINSAPFFCKGTLESRIFKFSLSALNYSLLVILAITSTKALSGEGSSTDTDPGYENLPQLAYSIKEKMLSKTFAPEQFEKLVSSYLSACNYTYQLYLLEKSENPGNINSLYAYASDGSRKVVYGIHYRFDLSDDLTTITNIIQSSKGCLEVDAIPQGKPKPMFEAFPNLVGNPNEMHILVSLELGYPMVLFDKKNKWLIFGNTVRKLAKKK